VPLWPKRRRCPTGSVSGSGCCSGRRGNLVRELHRERPDKADTGAMSEHPGSLIDYERSACLCDAGAPEYLAAVCVTPTGDDVLWLVSQAALYEKHRRAGNPLQQHERLGRLPASVRDRIWGNSLRCGRPTSSGQPCRQRVKEPGQACGLHAARAAAS
jgi:hypothetical protein